MGLRRVPSVRSSRLILPNMIKGDAFITQVLSVIGEFSFKFSLVYLYGSHFSVTQFVNELGPALACDLSRLFLGDPPLGVPLQGGSDAHFPHELGRRKAQGGKDVLREIKGQVGHGGWAARRVRLS